MTTEADSSTTKLLLTAKETADSSSMVNPPHFDELLLPSGDTLYYATNHPEWSHGIAGDPIPYTVRGDSVLTLLLIACFMILTISVAQSKRFIIRQLKYFFFIPRNDSNITETSQELHFQSFLAGLSCLLSGIIVFQYTNHYITDTFLIGNELILIALLSAVFLTYIVGKAILYLMVNSVFFDPTKNRQWQKVLLFINAMVGILLFPAVLLTIYFDLSLDKAAYYFVSILFSAEILTFYKGWSIFFRQNRGFLKISLYFCTLEITPLLCLASGLLILIDNLKPNF
jgi:hypothetical protein